MNKNIDKMKVKITLLTPILGSLPGNKEVLSTFIASKAPTPAMAEEEVQDVEENTEKATTFFPKDEKGIFMWDYQFKGFIKESISVMIDLGQIPLSKYIYKRVVDSAVFVTPRKMYFKDEKGELITKCEKFFERPLRATTMQGDRVALARSQILPEGVNFESEITLLKSTNAKSKFSEMSLEVLNDALNYGKLKGLGQFRNGGYGSFEWNEIK